MRLLFWLCLIAMLALYGVMAVWSMPLIVQEADGLLPFDLRPFGYTPAAARDFLNALSDEGRAFYLNTQHLLDSAYPGLLGVTLLMLIWRLFHGGWRLALAAVAIIATLADYLENAWVATLLAADPALLADATIEIASWFTVVKSMGDTVVFVALLIGGGRRLWARRKPQKRSPARPRRKGPK